MLIVLLCGVSDTAQSKVRILDNEYCIPAKSNPYSKSIRMSIKDPDRLVSQKYGWKEGESCDTVLIRT